MENFFKGFQIILISSWYRSMWTIGRSQHGRNQILRNGHCDVISTYSFPQVIVKNGGCISSHNKRGEQAFYTKYTGK
jgi:hypothetical protein